MNFRLAYSHAILVTKIFYPPTLVFFVLIQTMYAGLNWWCGQK